MLQKSKKIHIIDCGNENFIVYNTLLNKPIFLDRDSYNFFINLKSVINIENYQEEEIELITALKDSYLLLDYENLESNICKFENLKFAKKIEQGKVLKFIDFRISEICNFACKHCISKEARNGKLMSYSLAKDFAFSVMSFITKNNPELKEVNIHYGNAEPLINFEIIKKIENYFDREWSGIKRKKSINTNLSLLTPEIAGFLVEHNISIYASLDGDKKANDSIRVLKNGLGTFDIIISKMNILKNIGHPLEGVSVTLTDKNFKHFSSDKFVVWCIENRFKSLAIDFDLVNSVKIPVDERIDFLIETWERCMDSGIEFFGTWITPFLNLINRSIVDNHYAFCKGIHGESLSVDPEGNLYLCGSSSKKLGHFSEIQSIFTKKGFAYDYFTSNLIGNNYNCNDCIIEGACAGQCRVTLEYSKEKTVENCVFYRKLTEKLLISYGRKEFFNN